MSDRVQPNWRRRPPRDNGGNNDVVFLDIEASGLGPDKPPIEIGLSRIASDMSFRTWAKLIRPHPSWDPEKWSRKSRMIHNFVRENLENAPQPETVAASVIDQLRNAVVVSGGSGFDIRRLDALLLVIDQRGTVVLRDFDSPIMGVFGRRGVAVAFSYLNDTYTPHRAGPDVERLAHPWLAAARRPYG